MPKCGALGSLKRGASNRWSLSRTRSASSSFRHCGICCHRPGNRGRAELQGCEAMRETIIMRGAYVITDPRLGASGVIPAGAVVIVDGTIRETGPFAAIASKYPGISVVGDGTQLLMPGLVDAHSHGRGLFADPERCARRLSGKRSLRLGVGMNPCSTSRSIGSIAEHRPGPRVRIPFAPAASQQRTVPGVGRRWSQKDESDADVL